MLSGTVLSILLICATPFLGGIFACCCCWRRSCAAGCKGVVQPMMFSVQAKAVGRYRQGSVVGLRQTMNRLAAIVIPPIMGVIADWWGATESFVVLGVFLLLAVRADRAHHPPRRRDPPSKKRPSRLIWRIIGELEAAGCPTDPRYDDDFYAWTQYQAEVLRSMRTRRQPLRPRQRRRGDRGFGQERARRGAQPSPTHPGAFAEAALFAGRPIRDLTGWRRSSRRAPSSLKDQIYRRRCGGTSRRCLRGSIADARERAELGLRGYGEKRRRRGAARDCPYTLDQILRDDWYPEPCRAEMTRDFVGYGAEPPHAHWPGKARVAVNFVINFEEGSELSYPAGDGVSETGLIEAAEHRCRRSAATSPPRACSNTAAASGGGGSIASSPATGCR